MALPYLHGLAKTEAVRNYNAVDLRPRRFVAWDADNVTGRRFANSLGPGVRAFEAW